MTHFNASRNASHQNPNVAHIALVTLIKIALVVVMVVFTALWRTTVTALVTVLRRRSSIPARPTSILASTAILAFTAILASTAILAATSILLLLLLLHRWLRAVRLLAALFQRVLGLGAQEGACESADQTVAHLTTCVVAADAACYGAHEAALAFLWVVRVGGLGGEAVGVAVADGGLVLGVGGLLAVGLLFGVLAAGGGGVSRSVRVLSYSLGLTIGPVGDAAVARHMAPVGHTVLVRIPARTAGPGRTVALDHTLLDRSPVVVADRIGLVGNLGRIAVLGRTALEDIGFRNRTC